MHLQLYQLYDTIWQVGFTEHCFFIQLSWYDLPDRPCRGAWLKGWTIPILADSSLVGLFGRVLELVQEVRRDDKNRLARHTFLG